MSTAAMLAESIKIGGSHSAPLGTRAASPPDEAHEQQDLQQQQNVAFGSNELTADR